MRGNYLACMGFSSEQGRVSSQAARQLGDICAPARPTKAFVGASAHSDIALYYCRRQKIDTVFGIGS